MSRKLIMLAAILLGSMAFARDDVPANLVGLAALVGPNSTMHTKALPNDGLYHEPYLQWSGTANADVQYVGQTLIHKGDIIRGLWGGRRASSGQSGHLVVKLIDVNGQKANANSYKDSGVSGQDTWVSAGSVIPFITCNAGVTCPWRIIP
jgi:hypothetical protein